MNQVPEKTQRNAKTEEIINKMQEYLNERLLRSQQTETAHPISALIPRPPSIRQWRSPNGLESTPQLPTSYNGAQYQNNSINRNVTPTFKTLTPGSTSNASSSSNVVSSKFALNGLGSSQETKADAEVSAYLKNDAEFTQGVNWRLLFHRRRVADEASQRHRIKEIERPPKTLLLPTRSEDNSSFKTSANMAVDSPTDDPLFVKHEEFRFMRCAIPAIERDSAEGSLNDDARTLKYAARGSGNGGEKFFAEYENLQRPLTRTNVRRQMSMRVRSPDKRPGTIQSQIQPGVSKNGEKYRTSRSTSLQRRLNYDPQVSLATESSRKGVIKGCDSPTKRISNSGVLTKSNESKMEHRRESQASTNAASVRQTSRLSTSRNRASLPTTYGLKTDVSAPPTCEISTKNSPQIRTPQKRLTKGITIDSVNHDQVDPKTGQPTQSPKRSTLSRSRSEYRRGRPNSVQTAKGGNSVNQYPDIAVDSVNVKLEKLAKNVVLLRKRVEKDYADAGSCSPGDDIYVDEEVGVVKDGRPTGMHPVIANSLRNIRLLEANVQELFNLLYPNEVEIWSSNPKQNGYL